MRNRHLFALLLLVAFAAPARAVDVTVASFTVNGWNYSGTTFPLRITADSDFVTLAGERVLRGTLSTSAQDVYRTVTCTANTSTKVLTCPTFTLPSTTDAQVNAQATWSGAVYSSTGARLKLLFEHYPLAASLASNTTLAEWTVSALSAGLADPPRTYYTAPEVDTQIRNQWESGNPAKAAASPTPLGRVALSVTPADPALPIAVGDNDPRLVAAGSVAGSYAYSSLPAPGSAGRLYRLTDKYRGVVLDTGTDIVSLSGETFNVKEFGAKGDGTTNDTAAIQAAIDACKTHGGGVVFFPPGTYKVTASGGRALYVDGWNITLRGAGQKSVIAMASASGDTVQLGTEGGLGVRASNAIVEYLQLTPSVTRTSGSEFFAPNFFNLTFREVRLDGVYRGFYLGSPTGCVDVKMFGVWMDNFYQFGYFVRVISGYFYGVQVDAMTSNAVVLHIDGYCEGLVFSGCLFINNYFGTKTGSYMLDIDNDVVSRPSMFNYFYGCLFDFGNYAVVAQDAYSYSFTDCWFKGATDAGVLLEDTAHDFNFKGCDFFNSGGVGLYVNGSDGHQIIGNRFYNNGVVISPSPGIRVADNGGAHSDGVVISSNRIGHSPAPRVSDGGLGSQNYGVLIDAGAVSFIVTGNDCRGNSTGDVQNLAGTSALKIVQNNIF